MSVLALPLLKVWFLFKPGRAAAAPPWSALGKGKKSTFLWVFFFVTVLFFAYLIVFNALRGDLVYGFGRKH